MKQQIVLNLSKVVFLVMTLFSSSIAFASNNEAEKKGETPHELEHNPDHVHNRFELEISINDAGHFEYTGSVYFLPMKKVQVTADQHFEHFASVVVQELPFRNSKFGTFVGIGGSLGIHEHEIDHNTTSIFATQTEKENQWSLIAQTGLAYSFNRHWSTGFTLSPGYNFTEKEMNFGATFDVVFGF